MIWKIIENLFDDSRIIRFGKSIMRHRLTHHGLLENLKPQRRIRQPNGCRYVVGSIFALTHPHARTCNTQQESATAARSPQDSDNRGGSCGFLLMICDDMVSSQMSAILRRPNREPYQSMVQRLSSPRGPLERKRGPFGVSGGFRAGSRRAPQDSDKGAKRGPLSSYCWHTARDRQKGA